MSAPTPPERPPAVPGRARTVIYIAALVVHVAAFLTLSILPVWDVIDAERAERTLAYVVTAVGMVTSGLAVGYRPTRVGSSTAGAEG